MRILIGLIFIVSSCGVFNGDKQEEQAQSKDKVAYEIVFQANERLVDMNQITVATNEKEMYENIYIPLNKTRMPPLEAPQINFEKESMVALSYKIENEDFNDLEIVEIYKKDEKATIAVKEKLNNDNSNNRNFKYPFFILQLEGKFQDAEVKMVD